MKIIKGIVLIVTFVIVFFVNFNWFFNPCARHVCPDAYGTSPLISPYPNFYIPQTCGGLAGDCIPAHWSFQRLTSDLIFMLVLDLIFLFVIKKVFSKTEHQTTIVEK